MYAAFSFIRFSSLLIHKRNRANLMILTVIVFYYLAISAYYLVTARAAASYKSLRSRVVASNDIISAWKSMKLMCINLASRTVE